MPARPAHTPAHGGTPPEPAAAHARAGAAAHAAPPPYGQAQARRRLAMGGWIAFGLVLAVGIVVAAVLLRPGAATRDGPDGQAETASAADPALPGPGAAGVPAGTPSAAASRPLSDPALAGVTSVRLRIGPDFPPERQSAILAALSEAGVPAVRVEPLPFRIATSRVGYYRPEDLVAAEALGRLISPVLAEGADVGVRDYGQLLADPEPGRLDLWVGG